MKKLKFISMLLIALLLAGCSPVSDVQNVSSPASYTKEKIDYLSLDRGTRQTLGICLNTSPDKKSYFLLDPISNFQKIHLIENDSQESIIFNYNELYGESAIRDMDEIQVFWGGMSDRIYLYRPFSKIPELSSYIVSTHSWENDDIAFMQGYKIIKAINQTNSLFAAKDGLFYSIDMVTKHIKQLNIPADSFIGDQNLKQVLFTSIDMTNNSELCRLGIYDLDKDSVKYLDNKNPISRDGLIAFFVPNSSKEISYLTEIIDNNGYVSSHLVIYDLSSGSNKLIYIGDGPQSFLGWDTKGHAFYGIDYIMKK